MCGSHVVQVCENTFWRTVIEMLGLRVPVLELYNAYPKTSAMVNPKTDPTRRDPDPPRREGQSVSSYVTVEDLLHLTLCT